MTAALEGVSGQQHAPAALYPREKPVTHFTGGWVVPQGRSGRAENLVPTGIRSRTVQPVASRYTILGSDTPVPTRGSSLSFSAFQISPLLIPYL